MTKDFADFLDSLNSEGVAYVVIGGMAVLSHVPYRTTRDLDVLIEPTLDNAHRAREAIGRWGGFEPDFSAEEFISGDILSFGGLRSGPEAPPPPAGIVPTWLDSAAYVKTASYVTPSPSRATGTRKSSIAPISAFSSR